MGNFCDQQSWLIVSSLVSQALVPSYGTVWPSCAASLAGVQGHPCSRGSPACLAGPQRFLPPPAVGLRAEAVPRVSGSRCPCWSQPQPPLLPVLLGILCAEHLKVAGLVPPRALSLPRAGCAASLEKCCGDEVSIVLEHNTCLLLPVLLSLWPVDGMAGLETSRADGTFQFPLCFCTQLSTCRLLSVGPAFGFGADDNAEFLRKHHQCSGPGPCPAWLMPRLLPAATPISDWGKAGSSRWHVHIWGCCSLLCQDGGWCLPGWLLAGLAWGAAVWLQGCRIKLSHFSCNGRHCYQHAVCA